MSQTHGLTALQTRRFILGGLKAQKPTAYKTLLKIAVGAGREARKARAMLADKHADLVHSAIDPSYCQDDRAFMTELAARVAAGELGAPRQTKPRKAAV